MTGRSTLAVHRYRLQLGLIHLAVAMTLVPINSTLNRIMIKEMGFAAVVVAALASLPYLASPVQVFIGGYADQHPIWGFRRTPYILAGLALCALGMALTPHAAALMQERGVWGAPIAVVMFGLWGMGYNLATVSYFSLLSERFPAPTRGRAVAVMMVMMIVGIIATSVALSRMLEPYTFDALITAFRRIGWVALVLGGIGLLGLEPKLPPTRQAGGNASGEARRWKETAAMLAQDPLVRRFFLYLLLLLTALLAQDVLLEPFAAEAFHMPVHVTTRITAIWGLCFLITLLVGGWLETRVAKGVLAQTGNGMALAGFLLIIVAGVLARQPLFYLGLVVLGSGSGLSTVSNMSLMFDFTPTGKVGLYMGVWGMASALSRWMGSIGGGLIRDVVSQVLAAPVYGYLFVFGLEAALLGLAIYLLPRVPVRQEAGELVLNVWERAAVQE